MHKKLSLEILKESRNKTRMHRWENNIKMDFKGIGCEGGFSYNELSNCIKAYHFLRK
jgi:hypothetical protein